MASREHHSEAASESLDSLFPLPLSPFEKLIVWDERPPHPMNSFIELHFESLLDRDILSRALTRAVHRNPLLACRIVESEGELQWHYDAEYVPTLRMEREDPPLRNGWPIPIDLGSECGSRYWYGATETGSRLLIQLHHACSDGVGLRSVLIDMLTSYAKIVLPDLEETSVKTKTWEQLDMASLRDRFDYSKSFSTPPTRKITAWQRIKNAYYFHFQLPKPLQGRGPRESTASESPTEPLRHVIMDRATSERIMGRSREEQVSVNELGLALLFQACAQWNRQRGDRSPRSRIRLLMPYDLRSRADMRLPATNRLSFSFLGRTAGECGDLQRLIASVQSEIKAIKESRLPMDFLDALQLADSHPKLMKWGISKSRNMSTAVLTYAGDVCRGMKKFLPEQDGARMVGDARMTNIMAAPPVRENTNIALGLCINWGQLCVSAAWNRDVLSAEECRQFLVMYESKWRAWADGSTQ